MHGISLNIKSRIYQQIIFLGDCFGQDDKHIKVNEHAKLPLVYSEDLGLCGQTWGVNT